MKFIFQIYMTYYVNAYRDHDMSGFILLYRPAFMHKI